MRKHPLAECEKCPFADAPYVPTQNLNPKIKLAVIGEAPGAYEAQRGIPFTGPSGKLLDQVLSNYGYNRNELMVSNICSCRPDNNDDPPASAVRACAPRLAHEIAAAGIEQILALGGTAATNLINTKQKITKIRVGPPQPYKNDESIEVVSTWHPAFCLRTPDSFIDFVNDIRKLENASRAPYLKPRYAVPLTEADIRKAIQRLSELEGPIVIDIETGFDKDTTVDHAENYNLLCVGVCFASGKAIVFPGDLIRSGATGDDFGELLRRKSIIAHNGKSDLAGLYPHFGELELFADTMLQHYTLDERPGHHTLEELGIEILNAPNWKKEIKEYIPRGGSYADIPPDKLYAYNAMDVCVTWDLYWHFLANMDERAQKEHNFLIAASNTLRKIERNGITFDVEYNEDLNKKYSGELFNIRTEIEETAERPINPNSWQQILRYYSDSGLTLTSTDADTLNAVLPYMHGNPRAFTELLLLHRRKAKEYGTYVKGLAKRVHNGKIFTTYSLHSTTSGRLSSKAPNLQNIKRSKSIKRQFTVEDENNVLIQVDYKQAEGRVITALARDEYLAVLFSDPTKDIFNDFCDQIWGLSNWGVEERVKIKTVFYGLAYGRGPVAIAQELSISEAESRELVRNFKALIPATVAWQASVTHTVLSGNDLITPFGRKRSFYLITDSNKADVLNEALSFLPQSIASDICLTAAIDLERMLRGVAKLRLTVHDALYAECLEEDQETVIDMMCKSMTGAGNQFTDYVPFTVDVKVGKNWAECS